MTNDSTLTRLTVDGEARAAYVRVQVGPVARTVEASALVDVDDEGRILGIELLEWPL